MKGDTLYDVIAFILNEASEEELEVVRSALKRRIEGGRGRGAMGVDPERIARTTASKINEQLGASLDQIRAMVANFAVDIIRKNAPELDEEQIQDLLDSWIPESGAKAGRTPATESPESASDSRRSPAAGAHRGRSQAGGGPRLAPDVILTMVTQFLSYSDESMSVGEQVKLNQEIPDWQRRYWEQFSPRVRELLSLYLRGEIDRATCLERICADLGIDADFSS